MSSSPFQTQFALSLELSKFLPLGPVASSLGRAGFQLFKNITKSGSDVFAEESLAKIFGRNRIDGQFASSFRTLVGRSSRIHELPAIVEIVLEVGGPTAARALTEESYFATIVQLSLLTYCHNINDLTRYLGRALERRVIGSTEIDDIPDHAALKGTLNACRTQTSAFKWHDHFQAVETLLKGIMDDLRTYESRPLSPDVLQALLDFFTAVQTLPENNIIHVESVTGFATIVVWAHRLLGLTVTVRSYDKAVTFGKGQEHVLVTCRNDSLGSGDSSTSLLTETRELRFQVSSHPNVDPPLEPSCRHPAYGYGSCLLNLATGNMLVVLECSYRIVASCLRLAQDIISDRGSANTYSVRGYKVPSEIKILNAGSMLFGDLHYEETCFKMMLSEPCLCTSNWQQVDLPEVLQTHLRKASNLGKQLRKLMRRLGVLLLAFAAVADLDHSADMPLDLYAKEWAGEPDFRFPTPVESFEIISKILLGTAYDGDIMARAALISAWGWSVFISSIYYDDPADVRPEISIQIGVPSRYLERRSLILDEKPYSFGTYGQVNRHNDGDYPYECVATPGERAVLRNSVRERNKRSFVTVTDDAFVVSRQFEFEKDPKTRGWVSHRFGFRTLQEISWHISDLPECDHSTRLGEQAEVPQGTWCFSGIDNPPIKRFDKDLNPLPDEPWTQDPNGWVHAGLVAGNSSARWALLNNMQHWGILSPERNHANPEESVFLRGNECCFQCALDMTTSRRKGRVLGLVL